MAIKEIIQDGIVLARHIPNEDWKEGLGFYSKDEEFIQVGTWGYDSGKELLKHIHNEVERKVRRTQEVLYIRKGKISAKIYDLHENFIEELFVSEGDTLILLDSGHGYTILEDNTQVLEVKNGPYLGADIDRRRF
ncbi:hypothetical protein DWB61_16920 [Ancylomarina euxinus]|uniref:Uncharacterized protein n=1 Tax=Ancylomarina euxinus TaxID=2283627 RepID=A0A425XWQ4_9BACT|nr:hypothetical protein [Ancylomarina euxinus]MCZ4696349.1 hypothetical protein [Ancylomarina euxinus]MUP16750.1 hypothetical protein [Ancylomarina euxinus]RRG19070.1 hypothetical protein DWB61_16920 [Ancylomarina euxinus]